MTSVRDEVENVTSDFTMRLHARAKILDVILRQNES